MFRTRSYTLGDLIPRRLKTPKTPKEPDIFKNETKSSQKDKSKQNLTVCNGKSHSPSRSPTRLRTQSITRTKLSPLTIGRPLPSDCLIKASPPTNSTSQAPSPPSPKSSTPPILAMNTLVNFSSPQLDRMHRLPVYDSCLSIASSASRGMTCGVCLELTKKSTCFGLTSVFKWS